MKRSKPLKRTPLRRVSKRRAKALKAYTPLRRGFLAAHPFCQVCHYRNRNSAKATDVHHMNGRHNERLNATEDWLAVCRCCHDHIHAHPAWGRAMGFLK